MSAILNLRFLLKVEKYKIASISLTVRDGAISLKFSTPRVSKQYTMLNFGKVFKFGGHFDFLPKVANQKIASISLTVREFGKSDFVQIFHPQGI